MGQEKAWQAAHCAMSQFHKLKQLLSGAVYLLLRKSRMETSEVLLLFFKMSLSFALLCKIIQGYIFLIVVYVND